MDSSSEPYAGKAWERMIEGGRTVAERGCALLTGACPGLPYGALLGAKQAGGLVVGISLSLHDALQASKRLREAKGGRAARFAG